MLKPCGECSASVSEFAKTCPHCGVRKPHKPPGLRAMSRVGGTLIKVALLIIFVPFAMMAFTAIVNAILGPPGP